MVTASELDLGTQVYWLVGTATGRYTRHGQEYAHHVAGGRVLSVGRTQALVELDANANGRRLCLLPLRRLHLTEQEAQAEQWSRDACPLCGGQAEGEACVEGCQTGLIDVRGY